MTSVFNVKKQAIWHTTPPIYNVSTAINMDMLPWIALIKYHHQAHQHSAEVTPLMDMIGHPLGIIVTPDALTIIIKIGHSLVVPDPAHITMDIGVAAIMTPVEATPGHPTDLHDVVSHTTEAQAHTATTVTCHTADIHPIEIFPEMTTDLDTIPETLQTSTRIFFKLTNNTMET